MKKYPDAVSQLMEILKKNPRGLNILEISVQTGINRMSVAKYLEVLTVLETVEVRTVGSAKIYHLSRRIPLSTFLKHTSRFYFVIDENMVMIQLNEKVVPVVGQTEDQMIGKTVRQLIGNQVINLEACEASIAKALGGEETSMVIEVRLGDTIVYYNIVNTPIEFPDGSRGVLITSDQLIGNAVPGAAPSESAEKFRALVEQIPDIVFSAGPDGVLEYTGPQLARYGFVPEELAGHPFDRLVDPRDRDAAMARLLAVGSSPGPVPVIRFRAALPGGRTVWFEANCVARQDRPGAACGIIGVLRDVTGREGAGPAPGTSWKK